MVTRAEANLGTISLIHRTEVTNCCRLLHGVCQVLLPPFSQLGALTFSVPWCLDRGTLIGPRISQDDTALFIGLLIPPI